MSETHEKRTRYPGLSSFTTAQKDLFFGRKQETRDLFNLISVERTVVLFSKSGYGKTSLLQAGVIPLLYGQWMVPVLIRFGTEAYTPESHFSIQLDTVWQQFNGKTQEEAQKTAKDTSSNETFWVQIARSPFGDAPVQFTPLFIFDQFEELFTLYPDPGQRKRFVQELADLIHERMPDALRKQMVADRDRGDIGSTEVARMEKAPPMRFVFSIRSDMLHFMDELSEAIPYILRSRYQLFGLNEAQATDAIIAPAALQGENFASQPFSYTPEATAEIIGTLTKNREVESFQLQAVCQAIEEKIMRGQRQKFDPMRLRPVGRDGLRAIDPDFYGGREGIDNIIEENYNQRIDSLGDQEETWPDLARHILEDVLVNKNDRRQSIDVVELAAPKALLDELERQRLVRKEPRLDSFYFEISHDTWLPAIVKSRKVRKEAEEAERRELERIEAERRALEAEEKAFEEKRRAEEAERLQQQAEKEKKKAQKMSLLAIGMSFLACLGMVGAGWLYDQSQNANKVLEEQKLKIQSTNEMLEKQQREIQSINDTLLKQTKDIFLSNYILEEQTREIQSKNRKLERQKANLQNSIDQMRRAQIAQKTAEQGKKRLDLDRLLNEALTYAKAREPKNAEAKLKEAEGLNLPDSRERIEAMRRQIQDVLDKKH